MATQWTPKAPTDVDLFEIDWATDDEGGEVLSATDTILTSEWTVETGLTEGSNVIRPSSRATAVWLSGGTVSEVYEVSNTITTAEGRTLTRVKKLRVQVVE